jgi:hypothetical protein
MTIEHDRAVARKMAKLHMFDIAASIKSAAREVLSNLHFAPTRDGYEYRGSPTSIEWLEDACNEWERYVNETKRELGIC